ncbi:excalibur calcium-binding domain-containing protein [Streptomyces sp. NPDC091201]|uniref:excalibur calcium-binding domain-containing protein n=1 Tax=Streptomyces sp. NPDC091201 TaxID=3155190 RepID=UPI003435DB6D
MPDQDQPRTLQQDPGRRPRPGRRSRPGRRGTGAPAGVLAALAAIALTACAGGEPPLPSYDVAPYVHQGHVADCGAFKAQAHAQAVLRADTLDPNELDRDGDGVACPHLPGPKDEKPVHRDFRTDVDGAPISEPLKSAK